MGVAHRLVDGVAHVELRLPLAEQIARGGVDEVVLDVVVLADAPPALRRRALRRAAVDAGADLVVGHGPHSLRGAEFRDGKLIAYSLGNFGGGGVFGAEEATRHGVYLDVVLDADGCGMGGVGGSFGWWSRVGGYTFAFLTGHIGDHDRGDRLENSLRGVLGLPPV